MSTFGALSLVSGFPIVAAVIGQFGIETRNKRFEDAFLGAFVIFLGFNLWVPATYVSP